MEDVTYELKLPPFASTDVEEAIDLAGRVFGRVDADEFRWRVANLPDPSLALASEGGALVGFKCGYALASREYYSWLGGVVAHARRRGVARRLMELQHSWLAERPYASVETGTANDNTAMLELNREFGFEAIGSYTRRGELRVILVKQLG